MHGLNLASEPDVT